TVADLDEDGRPDLAVADAAGATILRADEAGGYTFAGSYGPHGSRSIVAADLDRDGHADLVLGNPYGNDVGVVPDRTLDPVRCRAGNVNGGPGGGAVADVLFVDGSPGVGPSRRLVIDRRAPFEIRMDAPPSRPAGPSAFALYAWVRREPTRRNKTE